MHRAASNGGPSNTSGGGGSSGGGSGSGGALSVLDSFFVTVESSFEKVLGQVDAAAISAAKFINDNLDSLPDQQNITKSLISPPNHSRYNR